MRWIPTAHGSSGPPAADRTGPAPQRTSAKRAPGKTGRQQRLQPRPLRISQVMPFQPVLIHGAIQAERPTRSTGHALTGRVVAMAQAVPGHGRAYQEVASEVDST